MSTLHQDSETASKPTFFRGHHWGCVALLTAAEGKRFATSLEARIHEGLELYSRRVAIEVLFDTLKNTQGGMGCHFWPQALSPASRRPMKSNVQNQKTTELENTRKTLGAIEKFANLHLLVIGLRQLLAIKVPNEVKGKVRCWLRTVSSSTPSEFVTRNALANALKRNPSGFAQDPIARIIRQK